jgi:hypothetical protein
MPKYIVTGGESGEAEIEIKGKTYSPGDTIELTGKSDDWLVKQGHLVPEKKKGDK